MKYFVSGGCSFSECITGPNHTWPGHLEELLPAYEHIPRGMGSSGNGLISRRVIQTVTELLKEYPDHTHFSRLQRTRESKRGEKIITPGKNILVGIMWSGPNRHDYYTTTPPEYLVGANSINTDNNLYGMENPTSVVSDNNWVILNHQWANSVPHAGQYYKYFHDSIGSLIYTYEHILRTQWFLELHGINYFMSTYTGEVFPDYGHDNSDVKHLVDQIDRSIFLPVVGEYEWCRDYSNLPFPVEGDNHPSQAQHKLFVEQVVWPFLKIKNYVE